MSEKLNISQAREELAEEQFATTPSPEQTLSDVGDALHGYKQAYDNSPEASMTEFGKLQEALIAHEANGGVSGRIAAESARDEEKAPTKHGRIARALGKLGYRVAAIPRALRVKDAKDALEYGAHSSGTVAPGSNEPGKHRSLEQQLPEATVERPTASEVRDQAIAEGRDVEITPASDGFDDLRDRLTADFADQQSKFDAILGRDAESVPADQLEQFALEAVPASDEQEQDEEKTKHKGRLIKLVRMVFGSTGVKKVNRLRYHKHKNRAQNVAQLDAEKNRVHDAELVDESHATPEDRGEPVEDIIDAEVVNINELPQTPAARAESIREELEMQKQRALEAAPAPARELESSDK